MTQGGQTNLLTVLEQPDLPGLLPNATIAETLKQFHTFREGGDVVINRMPNMAERQGMQRRREELNYALARAIDNAHDYAKLKLAVLGWLNSYSSLQHGDQQALGASYNALLGDLPLWAVTKAIKAVVDRTARFVDSKGREVHTDPAFAPSAIQIRSLVEKYITAAVMERHEIETVLYAKKLARPEVSDEERKRVGADMAEWAAARRAEAAAADAEEQAKRQAEESHKRGIDLMTRGIMAEYADAGLKPHYQKSGQLMSLPMAQKLGIRLEKVEKKRA